MDDIQTQSMNQSRSERKERDHRRMISLLLTVVLWCGLLYGGYVLADGYLERSKQSMAQEITRNIEAEIAKTDAANQEKFKALEEEMASVSERLDVVMGQITAMNENLSIADESMNGTHETREALETQITLLNEQLDQLKESIQALEEAARVY